MINPKFLKVSLLALGLVLGQAAVAKASEGGCGCVKKMTQTLNLDQSQQVKVKAIKEQLKASQALSKEKIKALNKQINQLVQNNNLDQGKLDSLIIEKKELLAASIKARALAKNQIYNLLNEEQKSGYQKMINDWESHSGHKQCKKQH